MLDLESPSKVLPWLPRMDGRVGGLMDGVKKDHYLLRSGAESVIGMSGTS